MRFAAVFFIVVMMGASLLLSSPVTAQSTTDNQRIEAIEINGNKALIKGNIKFNPAELMATDLRASVSLILAALTTKGKSIINRIYHLDRGYENIEKKLKKVGARVKRLS